MGWLGWVTFGIIGWGTIIFVAIAMAKASKKPWPKRTDDVAPQQYYDPISDEFWP